MNYSKHVVRKMKLSSEMKGKPFHFLIYHPPGERMVPAPQF